MWGGVELLRSYSQWFQGFQGNLQTSLRSCLFIEVSNKGKQPFPNSLSCHNIKAKQFICGLATHSAPSINYKHLRCEEHIRAYIRTYVRTYVCTYIRSYIHSYLCSLRVLESRPRAYILSIDKKIHEYKL